MGSFGYLSASASYGKTLGDADLLLGASGYESDGYRTNSASRAATVYSTAGWFVNDTDTLTLRLSGGRSDARYPGSLTYEQMQEDPTQSGNAGDQFSEDRSGQATLLYETERKWGAARINSGLNYRDRDSDFSGIYTWNRQAGLSLAPRVRIGSEEDFWMTGLDIFYDRLDVENYLTADRDIVESRAELDRITAAPYVFAQRTLGAETILNGGGRYEYAGTDNQYVEYVKNQLSPNLGPFPNPNYQNPPDVNPTNSFDGLIEKQGWAAEISVAQPLSEQWDVFAGYDRVYRYPSLDEAAAYQGFPLSDPLNEDLEPERGNNYELGSRFSGREWTAALTGFYMALDNEIVYDDTARLNVNAGSTRRIGIEPEVTWIRAWYGASTRWTFVDARLEEGANKGNRVPLVPWAYGTTSMWVEPVPVFRLTATYTYVSEQYQGGDEENVSRMMDAYGLVGLRVNVLLSDDVSLVLSADNLADETYAVSAYSGGFYPGAGRSYRAGITVVY
jgi:iron complex outermembrane receptor protein